MSEEFLKVQCETDGEPFEVAYSILSPEEFLPAAGDPRRAEIMRGLENAEAKTDALERRIAEINQELEKYTNTADKLDYTVAVASGVLCGLIDAVFVGEFSIENAQNWSNEKINEFVMKTAKKHGYSGNDLSGAVKSLEDKFGAPSDSVTSALGGGKQHHLRDFAHHPTLVGLIFSLLTQFTSRAYGTDTYGRFMTVAITNKKFIGESVPQKILYGVGFWLLHLVSDMAGSNKTAGAGAGLPGPILSLAKELSVLPIFKNITINDLNASKLLSKLYNGTLFAERDEAGKIIRETVKPFDLRMEVGIAHEVGKQALPVILNECIVRGVYFSRRLSWEMRDKQVKSFDDLKQVDWKKTVPFNNRTIVRMMTIASGTFTAIDMAGAAIQGAAKSGGNTALFVKEFLLNVNFVGVGRFVIAVGADVAMGIKAGKLRNERLQLSLEMMHWTNTKVFYTQANMWISAENAQKALIAAYQSMEVAYVAFANYLIQAQRTLDSVDIAGMEQYNPGLVAELLDCLHE